MTPPSYELCGNISTLSTKQFYSSTSTLVMRFHSGMMRGNQTGFRGIYRFIDKGLHLDFDLIAVGDRRVFLLENRYFMYIGLPFYPSLHYTLRKYR
jgi:hypothetical protein